MKSYQETRAENLLHIPDGGGKGADPWLGPHKERTQCSNTMSPTALSSGHQCVHQGTDRQWTADYSRGIRWLSPHWWCGLLECCLSIHPVNHLNLDSPALCFWTLKIFNSTLTTFCLHLALQSGRTTGMCTLPAFVCCWGASPRLVQARQAFYQLLAQTWVVYRLISFHIL